MCSDGPEISFVPYFAEVTTVIEVSGHLYRHFCLCSVPAQPSIETAQGGYCSGPILLHSSHGTGVGGTGESMVSVGAEASVLWG